MTDLSGSTGMTRRYLAIPAAFCALYSVAVAAQESRTIGSHLEEIEATARTALEQAGAEEALLMRYDLDFAADARARHVSEAFADRFLPQGVLIGSGGPVITGPDAVREALKGSTAEWYWTPVKAQVSGDLGVTWGIAALILRDAEPPQVHRTRYVTVWNRGEDGEWRIAIDIGNEGPGPE